MSQPDRARRRRQLVAAPRVPRVRTVRLPARRPARMGGPRAPVAAGRRGRPGLRRRRGRRLRRPRQQQPQEALADLQGAADSQARDARRPSSTWPSRCCGTSASWSSCRPGLEADDVLASVAAQAPAMGARTVVATSDRDSFALIDEHTKMLRILNGGVDASPLLDPARLAMVTGVRPEQYSDLAALRGDASDNLPGVMGFGAKTAVKLLTDLDTAEAAFADALAGGERCKAAVGCRARQDPGHRRGSGALRLQPRGDGDGHHRRARAGRHRRRRRAAARRGDGAPGLRPLRAARRLRGPGADPPGAHPHRRADVRGPALDG